MTRPVTRRPWSHALGLAAGLALAASGAQALPPVLEHVPEGAMVVVAIPDPARVEANVAALAAAIELPIPKFTMTDVLGMAGIFEGVETTKSLAVVVMPPPNGKPAGQPADKPAADKAGPADPMGGPEVGDDAEPASDPLADAPIYFLVPTDDYAKLLNNFGAKPSPEKGAADSIMLPDGSPMVARNLGNGYALVARTLEDARGYRPGKPAALKEKVGPAGDRMADAADVMMLIDVEAAAAAGPRLREFAQQRAAEMGGLGGFGMDFDPAVADEPGEAARTFERDGRAVVGALKLSSLGVSVESVTTFKPGSETGKLFEASKPALAGGGEGAAGGGAGGAGGALAKLPQQQFFLAVAADVSNAFVKQTLSGLEAEAKRNQDGGGQVMLALLSSLAKADAASFSLGASPALFAGGGVFSNAVGYLQTAQPGALADQMKTDIEALNGLSASGVTMTTAYKVGSAKAGTDPIDDITMKFAADPDNPQGSQMITGLFGPAGGPSGYLFRGKDGLIRTFAKQSILMQSAIKAAAGTGPNLGGDQLLTQVGRQLPAGRFAEMYIGVRPILDIGLPALMMFGGVQIDPADMPKQIPPIGMALAAEGGAARFGAFIPAPVIKVGALVASSVQEALSNLVPQGEPAGEDEPDEQPRF